MTTSIAPIGELDIAYDLRGSGAPLLLVPGFGMSRVMWEEELCDLLAAAGFTVVRMDNRDTGRSTRLDRLGVPDLRGGLGRSLLGLAVSTAYTLEDMAADGLALMRFIGYERFHVVGASMGGMIAQTMAIVAGERIASLTSVMSTPGGRRYAVADPRALRALMKPAPFDPAAQVEHFVALFRILGGDALPFDEPRARDIAEAHVATCPSPAGAARQFAAILDSSGRRRARLRELRTPTLVIHGTRDPLLPVRGAKAMASLVPGARLVLIEGMGHALHASAFARIANDITRHALG